jgi:hypothetical protein
LTEAGEHISERFIKQYLQERLQEYLALGGLKELVDRRALILANQKLPEHLTENLFGLSSDEEEEGKDDNSVVSWDTQ